MVGLSKGGIEGLDEVGGNGGKVVELGKQGEAKEEERNEERNDEVVSSWRRCHKIWLMKARDTENNIAILVAGVVLMLVGEGILNWGGWLVILWMMSGWPGIFWYGLVVGVILSGMIGGSLGLASLVILVVLLLFSVLKRDGGEEKLKVVLVLALVGWLVDKMLGMSWSWWEILLSGGLYYLLSAWLGKQDSLSVRS